MAKYYLYFLLSIFIFINIIGSLEQSIHETFKKKSLLHYKLKKQKLYASNVKIVELMLRKQKISLEDNQKPFFLKKKKETIVFSEIQQNIQTLFQGIGGKIKQLNSGVVIKNKFYKKYPIDLTVSLIPEDLNILLKKLHKNKKYLFLDSIYIYRNKKKNMLDLKIRLLGYQLI